MEGPKRSRPRQRRRWPSFPNSCGSATASPMPTASGRRLQRRLDESLERQPLHRSARHSGSRRRRHGVEAACPRVREFRQSEFRSDPTPRVVTYKRGDRPAQHDQPRLCGPFGLARPGSEEPGISPGRVDVYGPDSTPGHKPFRSRRDRRADRRHPRQWFLRHEIRAYPCVGDERLPQIGSALATEVAALADLRSELLGCVRSVARLAERHWMVRAQLEEQRPQSDKQQHDTRIVIVDDEPVKDRQ